MKRKVFSLMMLCLFAFLGMANAQQSGMNVTPDPIDLGYRPLGAWMRPFTVQFTGTSSTVQTITSIEAENAFFVIDANLPGTVSSSTPFNFTVTHGEAEAGPINSTLVAITENRKAYLYDIMAVAYNPIAADVVETAPTITFPFTATVGEDIYDNYLLPGETTNGKDVIYKMTIENDVLFNANVEGQNGKVALYTEDFYGQPGPGADNNFTGLNSDGGPAGTAFEAMIGDENTTSSDGHFPFYTLYNYSISEQLYLASELTEAGMNALPIASLSFEAKNETGYEQKNISIWMANVSDAVLTGNSHTTNGMTLVYTGNITPVVGWNEFVFNQNQFSWDGVSNLLICVQRSNGTWNSTIQWKSYNPGFTGLCYAYRDGSEYNMAGESYSMYTSSYRVNTLFKSIGARDNSRDQLISDMTLTPGVYYLAASSTSDEFTVNANTETLPAPEQAFNPTPADGETGISMPATLSWEFGNYTTAYRVLLGTTYPPTQVVVDWTNELSNSLVVTNLYNNKNYFWRVDERNTNGETQGQIWGFTTTLNIPQNLTAANEKIYEGDALELSWAPINDRSYRSYNVYQNGVKINNAPVTTEAYTVNGLTYNMTDGYTFNVTAVYDEGESDFSNDLIAFVTGNGTVSGKVCELDGATGIAGVEITIEGVDEFQRPAAYTFTTGSNGTYNGTVLAGNYTAMAMKDGYQGMEYDGTFHVAYNENTPNINFTLQEILYPVGEVIAEEMSDTQVKVYWSQGIMSELLEDFETGDFSAFDWVNDATYPWSVVTTSPYEGSYCMKSGNESVNSSTSAIEVSVEINRDGEMSFYHKISSESSYDKGYFYIDGVEKVNVSGSGSWQEKAYPITAGVHTFKWAYTKDSSVSSNDDCYYVDNVSFIHDSAPVPEGTVYSFESGMDPWTSIDADGDGYGWEYGPDVLSGGYGHNSTEGFVLSRSYVNYVGALTPDNYLVSPLVTLGGSVTLYACGQDASYAAEHFGVAVSTSGTNPSDFTMLQEWTLSAKGEPYQGPRGNRAQGNWYQFTVDLSAYSGTGYVAIRHFNCTDMFYLDVDDIIISSDPARAFNHYNIYRATEGNEAEAELITSVTDTVFFDNDMASLAPGIYKWGVSRVYEGNRGNREVIESQNFESGELGNWTTIDADGDGYEWYVLLNSTIANDIPGHNNSDGHVTSASYQSVALNPDNYLVSPQVALGGTIHFYACAQDANWAAEHFGVAVSTTNNTSASAFTMLQEWTMSAKGEGQPTSETRSGNRAQGTWYEYTVDLSNYAGQTGYVAIRHFNCSDWFRLNVDDIEITGAGEPGPIDPPTPPIVGGNESDIVWSNTIEHNMYVTTTVTVLNNAGESPEGATVSLTNISEPELNLSYNVTLDETGYYVWENMRRGTYSVSVAQAGFESIEETVVINEDTQLRYVLTEIIEPVSDLYVSATGWAMFGDIPTPTPVDPTPVGGQWYYYDNGVNEDAIGTGGGQFWWGVMFPAGSYSGNMVTKVSAYDYMAMNGDVTIYNDGASAPATPVGNMSVTLTGSLDFVEFEFAEPLVIDPTKNVWVVFYNASGATYPAACCSNTGDANGRWVSLDGSDWMDLASAGLEYTFMIRAYIAQGAKGEVTEISYVPQTGNGGTLGHAGVAKANRGVEYYKVMLNGELEGTTTNPFFQHNVENLVEGETYTTTVQKMYSTGLSEAVSFDWVYTPCDNFEGLQGADAEWNGENVVLTWVLPEGGDGPTPPPTPPTNIYDFEDGTFQGWTSIDADGDGYGWEQGSDVLSSGYGHNGSSDLVLSRSYVNYVGALNPDNYFVSPQVTLGGQISFWACAQDASYAAEHFGVAVSTSTATASAFTTIQEWTMSAKGEPYEGPRGTRDQGNWYQYTVDLSAYAGQTGYVAIRHFNCTDWFYLDVDDIELGGGGDTPTPPDPPTPPTDDNSFSFDFEGGMSGWTTIDADGDGLYWNHSSNSTTYSGYDYTGCGHNGTNGFIYSQSYIDYDGSYDPDNYVISPQQYVITNGSTLTFWADNANDSYPDHFGVAVATTANNPTPNDFTMVWNGGAKGAASDKAAVRHSNSRYNNWRQHTVDLSAYAGQAVWIAFRHYNSYDYYEIWIDDVTLTPGSKTNRDVTYDFENGTFQGWTSIDADGDGYGWEQGSDVLSSGYGHNGSSDLVLSRSYVNYVGALNPDNYFVSPQMTLGGAISFWACAQDASYAAEHFGVAVSTSTATASAFTTIQEWTMSAKGEPYEGPRGTRAQGNWYQYTVDLSAYEGQTGYVAIRHFNCTDWFYLDVDDITLGGDTPTPPDPPTPPTPGNIYDFEDGTFQGWTSIDADGDGYGWEQGSDVLSSGYGHNGSSDLVLSRSYVNYVGALNPDNYFVSPQVTLGGQISFWACAQDASYAAEHFGVAVSTTTATASAFTTIQEWTMSAKGEPYEGPRGTRDQGNWYQYTVDLSAYAGQTGYVAIRHFNCTDWFYLDVDDIELSGTGDDPTPPPTPGANVRGVEIFRNGEWIAEVLAPAQTYTDIAPEDVEFYEIRVVYNGNVEDYTHYTMSCPEILVPAEVECIAPENLTGSYEYFGEDYFGALINWTYEGEVNTSNNFYDNGSNEDAIGTGGGQFWWGVMFPAGSYQGSTVMQVSAYDYMAMTGTVSIYSGGSTAPGTLISSMNIEFTGAGDFVDFVFDEPVEIDPTQNLWIILYNASGATYPAAVCANTGDANGRWVSLDGTSWMDLASAGLSNTFMVRAYTSDNLFFEVYRNGQVIDQVPYYETDIFNYFDEVAIGNYQYQVKAVAPDCESDFALTPDLSQNYVEINVTSVTENIETRVYPNPTTGIVNIEANGMSHLTVVNTLGQIVLDTNISGDQYQMNLGQFQAGVYMVRITTVDGVSVQRVTVAK